MTSFTLNVGDIVVCSDAPNAPRWRVLSFGPAAVYIRRLRKDGTPDRRSGMVMTYPEALRRVEEVSSGI